MAYSPDGKSLAVGSEDGSLSLWTGALLPNLPDHEPTPDYHRRRITDGTYQAVKGVAFFPDGTARRRRDRNQRQRRAARDLRDHAPAADWRQDSDLLPPLGRRFPRRRRRRGRRGRVRARPVLPRLTQSSPARANFGRLLTLSSGVDARDHPIPDDRSTAREQLSTKGPRCGVRRGGGLGLWVGLVLGAGCGVGSPATRRQRRRYVTAGAATQRRRRPGQRNRRPAGIPACASTWRGPRTTCAGSNGSLTAPTRASASTARTRSAAPRAPIASRGRRDDARRARASRRRRAGLLAIAAALRARRRGRRPPTPRSWSTTSIPPASASTIRRRQRRWAATPAPRSGQQRQIAFKYAADIWGKALDSPVPIVIDAMFAPLDCSGGLITLGHARAQTLVASVPPRNTIPGLPPNVLYPQPLADRLAGVDLDPGVADIVATFNGGLNDCDPNIDWYYGLDANAGSLTDLVEVVVHELGHGLGFASGVDLDTGAVQHRDPRHLLVAHLRQRDGHGVARHDRGAAPGLDAQRPPPGLDRRRTRSAPPRRCSARERRRWRRNRRSRPSSATWARPTSVRCVKDVTTTLTGPLVVGNPINGCAPVAPAPGGIFLLQGNSPLLAAQPGRLRDPGGRDRGAAHRRATASRRRRRSSCRRASCSILPIHHPGGRHHRAATRWRCENAGSTITLTLGADKTRLTGADAHGAAVSLRQRSGPARLDGVALGSAGAPGSDPGAGVRLRAPARRHHGDGADARHRLALVVRQRARSTAARSATTAPATATRSPDACRTDCARARCGDGVKDTGEACDLGAQNGAGGVGLLVDLHDGDPPPPTRARRRAATAAARRRRPRGSGAARASGAAAQRRSTGGWRPQRLLVRARPSRRRIARARRARRRSARWAVRAAHGAGAQNSRTSPSFGMRAWPRRRAARTAARCC